MTDEVTPDKQAELDAALELTPAAETAPAEAPADAPADPAPEAPAPEAAKTEAPAKPKTKAEKKAAKEATKTEAPAEKSKVSVEVKDENGNVRYRRLNPTRPSPDGKPKTKPRVPVKDRARIGKPNKDGISANPTHLQFPTDRWGLTKDLKKAIVEVASRIAGDSVKKELVDEVLRVGLGHLEAKFTTDNAVRVARQKEAEAK